MHARCCTLVAVGRMNGCCCVRSPCALGSLRNGWWVGSKCSQNIKFFLFWCLFHLYSFCLIMSVPNGMKRNKTSTTRHTLSVSISIVCILASEKMRTQFFISNTFQLELLAVGMVWYVWYDIVISTLILWFAAMTKIMFEFRFKLTSFTRITSNIRILSCKSVDAFTIK